MGKRHFAGDQQLSDDRCAFFDNRILRGELAKIRERLLSSPCGHERMEDSRGRVDGNLLSFPFRLEEPS